MAENRMTRWAGWSLVAIAALHTLFMAPHPYWGEWLTGGLWRGAAEPESMLGFWALPGGFVVVMALLGLLLARMGRTGQRVPGYVGWGLAAWAVACVALIGPSGFLLGLVPASLLVTAELLARRRAGHQRAGAHG